MKKTLLYGWVLLALISLDKNSTGNPNSFTGDSPAKQAKVSSKESSTTKINTALDFSETRKMEELNAKASVKLAFSYQERGMVKDAEKLINEAFHIYKRYNNKEGLAQVKKVFKYIELKNKKLNNR